MALANTFAATPHSKTVEAIAWDTISPEQIEDFISMLSEMGIKVHEDDLGM